MEIQDLLEGAIQQGTKKVLTPQPPIDKTLIPFADAKRQGLLDNLTHLGGKLPEGLQGVVTEAKDALQTVGGIIGGISVSSDTLNVLEGITKFDNLDEAVKTMVQSELDKLGFNSDVAPDWFSKEALNQGTLEAEIGNVWNATRKEILPGSAEPMPVAQPML
jgi:hypothetical protein